MAKPLLPGLLSPASSGPSTLVASQPNDHNNVLITALLEQSALSRMGLMWIWAGAQSVPG